MLSLELCFEEHGHKGLVSLHSDNDVINSDLVFEHEKMSQM